MGKRAVIVWHLIVKSFKEKHQAKHVVLSALKQSKAKKYIHTGSLMHYFRSCALRMSN